MFRTMRAAALATGATLAIALASPAAAQERPPVALKAEQCLRQNVDRVVEADQSLASAAEFLINFACAGEVAAMARYQRNMAYLEIFSVLAKSAAAPAAGANASAAKLPALPQIDPKTFVNPETGDLNLPPSPPGAPANPITSLLPVLNGLFGQLTSVNASPDLRRLAGDLVLAAHERQRSGRH